MADSSEKRDILADLSSEEDNQDERPLKLDEAEANSRNSITKSTDSNRSLNGSAASNSCGEIYITVSDPKKEATPMEAFITFLVETKTSRSDFSAPEFSIRRRYSDFQWLHGRLEVECPAVVVPPLPEKLRLQSLDRFDPAFVRLRLKGLDWFVKKLTESHPSLLASPSLNVFLTADNERFNQFRRQHKESVWNKVSANVHNLSASYTLKERPETFERGWRHAQILADAFSGAEKNFNKLARCHQETSQTLHALAEVFDQWADKNENPLFDSELAQLKAALTHCQSSEQAAAETLDGRVSFLLHHYSLLCDGVRSALRRRDGLQTNQNSLAEQLAKAEADVSQLSTSHVSSVGATREGSTGGWFSSKPQEKLAKAEAKVANLRERLETSKSNVESADRSLGHELDRWQRHQLTDSRMVLLEAATALRDLHRSSADDWQDVVDALEATTGRFSDGQRKVSSD